MNAAAAYARFRGSPAFLITLCAVLVACGIAHATLGFDPDWGLTNLSLSMEASISVALLMMDNAKQDAAQEKQLEYMLTLMEGVHQVLIERAESPAQLANKPATTTDVASTTL